MITNFGKIEEVINEEDNKTELLRKQEKFNEKCCIRCCQTFGVIFNRKQTCQFCKLFVCKSCANYDDRIKGYICKACLTEMELKHKSLDWFYNNVSKRYKRFGSAKVVRTLYKQTDGARTHHFHSDNESDNGYNRLLFTSFSQSGSLPAKTRPSLITMFPQVDDHEDQDMIRGRKEGKSYVTWFIGFDYSGIDNVLFQPPPILISILPNQTASSTISNGNVYKDNENKDNISSNTSLESIQMSTQTIPTAAPRKTATPTQTTENVGSKELDKKDIYREALENTKRNEEAKFKVHFGNLLQEMQQSFENLSPHDGKVRYSYGSSLYNELMTKYRSPIKDLLVSLSQRLELAVESFDETCAINPSLTLKKVKMMISKMVEDHLGESLDLTSDAALSDLSSLSDDSAVEQKSLENQIAQAVIARVLKICQNQNNVHLDLKEPIDNDTTDSFDSEVKYEAGSGNSLFSEERNLTENSLSYMKLDETDQNVPKEIRKDKNEKPVLPNLSRNIGNVNNNYHQYANDVSSDESESIGHCDVDGEINEIFEYDLTNSDNIKCQNPEQKNHTESAYELHTQAKFDTDDTQKVDKVKEIVDDSVNVKMEFEKLRSFVREVLPKPLHEEYNVTEEVEPEPIEEIMECLRFDHASSQMEFHNRIATFDKVHDSERHGLPDFSNLECEYHDIGVNEIDPDLLSMNLTSVAERYEELAEEEEESEEIETETHAHDWRGNWLFKGAQGLAAFNTIVESKEFGDGLVMVPQLNTIYAPLIGNIDVDDMSDMSENEDRDLNDEDSTFYPRTIEEITRIAHQSKHSTHGSALANISVQTEANSFISCSNSSFSDGMSHGSRRKQRNFDSYMSEKSQPKLFEDLIPAEGDDPKFEILPESVTVAEGEPAKLTCTVAGSQAIDVFWYKLKGEVNELENSENYDITKDGCRHELTMYNTRTKEAGQYMCMAISDKRQWSKYFTLTIKKNSQELKKPEFLQTLQDVEVKEGQSVKFRCKVKGYPQSRIVWYKDGHIIQNQVQYKLERFGNRDYILAIDSVTMDDDAEYSVLARNVAGDARSSAQLIVEPRGTPAEKVSVTDKKSSKTTNAEMEHKSYNFPDLSYLPLRRAKESKVLQSSTHTDMSEENKQSKESSANSAKNNGDMPSLIHQVLMTQDSVSNLVEDLQSSSKMTNATEKGQQLTSPYIDYFHNKEVVLCEKSQGATTSTPRSSDIDHIFNPESEGIHMAYDNTVATQSDISMEISQDMGPDSHTTEMSDIVSPTLVTTDVEKNIYSKADMKVTLGERSHLMSAANTEIETVESLGHTDSHSASPVFSVDMNHMTDSTNSSFEGLAVLNMSPDYTIQTQVVNLGPKRESKDPYRKYFYVTDTPKMKRKTPESSPRENKEAAHTEEKRTDVNDPSSNLAYQQKPATISENLSPHLPISPEREKLEPTFFKGVTSEQDLPESQAEFNEYGFMQLPSVNRLKAIFGGNKVSEKDTTLTRVHSITARNVPKEQLERLRNTFHYPSSHSHQNSVSISNDHNPGRARALLTGQQIKLTPVTAKEVYNSHNFKSSEESMVQSQVHDHQTMHVSLNVKTVNVDTSDINSKQLINPHLLSRNTNRPISSAVIGQSKTTQPIKSFVRAGTEAPKPNMQSDSSKPNLKKANETDNNRKGIKPLRIKTGAISAMSKFW